MKPHAKLFVSSGGCEGAFGHGKWQLLSAVKEHGSISKAASTLGRSYRKAWGDIKRAEKAIGRPLVVKIRGGNAGGQSRLTAFGEELLAAWAKYRGDAYAAIDAAYTRHLQVLLGPPEK